MKKSFYKITGRMSHPSIPNKILKDLQEDKEIRIKLMDAGSFRILESIYKQILKVSGEIKLEIFMYPERNIRHPNGKVDKWIISTKKEKKDKRLQAILSFFNK